MNTFRETSSPSDTRSADTGARRAGAAFQEKSGEAIEQAQQMAGEQLDQLQGMIRRNPLAATGIAAGIGFFLALLARR